MDDQWFPPGLFTVPDDGTDEAPPPQLAPAQPIQQRKQTYREKKASRFEFSGAETSVTRDDAKEIVKDELALAVERLEQKIKEAGGFDL